jgi:hypothetical protein
MRRTQLMRPDCRGQRFERDRAGFRQPASRSSQTCTLPGIAIISAFQNVQHSRRRIHIKVRIHPNAEPVAEINQSNVDKGHRTPSTTVFGHDLHRLIACFHLSNLYQSKTLVRYRLLTLKLDLRSHASRDIPL